MDVNDQMSDIMDRHAVRYYFEHRLLPQWFFQQKAEFVELLLDEKETLFNVIDNLFEENGVENPYYLEDFSILAAKITDDVLMLRLGFPEPEEEPLCYCAYLFFDESFEKISYFCIERGNAAGNDTAFVCAWTLDGMHCNYGNCSLDEQDDFIKCATIHMNREYGPTEKDDKE